MTSESFSLSHLKVCNYLSICARAPPFTRSDHSLLHKKKVEIKIKSKKINLIFLLIRLFLALPRKKLHVSESMSFHICLSSKRKPSDFFFNYGAFFHSLWSRPERSRHEEIKSAAAAVATSQSKSKQAWLTLARERSIDWLISLLLFLFWRDRRKWSDKGDSVFESRRTALFAGWRQTGWLRLSGVLEMWFFV